MSSASSSSLFFQLEDKVNKIQYVKDKLQEAEDDLDMLRRELEAMNKQVYVFTLI